MSDIGTQLREYFEASVERVETEDVLTRRIVAERELTPPRRRELNPAWAAAGAFAATIAVLGGSLALGAALRRPGFDGGALIPEPVSTSPVVTSGGWLLIPAMAVLVAAVSALIVRNRHLMTKERAMATTLEKRPAEQVTTVQRNNRWLVVALVVLAAALVAMAAWVIYDWASVPETAAPDEIEALIDAYVGAYDNGDEAAFLDATTDDYVFRSFDQARTQSEQTATVAMSAGYEFELVGELVVMHEGSSYYVTDAVRITGDGTAYVGVDAYRVVETTEGLKVAEHVWVGNL